MDNKSNDSDAIISKDQLFENGTQYKLEKYQELCCEVEADQKVCFYYLSWHVFLIFSSFISGAS